MFETHFIVLSSFFYVTKFHMGLFYSNSSLESLPLPPSPPFFLHVLLDRIKEG